MRRSIKTLTVRVRRCPKVTRRQLRTRREIRLLWLAMPTIAVIGGITIRIYYRPREHPPPHFHAIYGDHEASYDIRTRTAMSGKLPRTQHTPLFGGLRLISKTC